MPHRMFEVADPLAMHRREWEIAAMARAAMAAAAEARPLGVWGRHAHLLIPEASRRSVGAAWPR